jgi:hypothetical protein
MHRRTTEKTYSDAYIKMFTCKQKNMILWEGNSCCFDGRVGTYSVKAMPCSIYRDGSDNRQIPVWQVSSVEKKKMVQIKEVTSRRELKEFIRFPFTLYANNPYWVPPLINDEMDTLRKDRNPAFEYCEAKYWLAYQGDNVVGRIAGIINHKYIEKCKKRQVRFGWIDFIGYRGPALTIRWRDGRLPWTGCVHGPLGFATSTRPVC